ncbi:hypothetical protein BDB00DRAFT_880595 [Zychaea mexicana]|uniref:uncharacterized protein n=1 Tax=Zychaea mexicana TaxID=64656 RepID=UPI0022FDD4C9|nr:uncharacterized protein BDB00DRAFT_880595 [Zychaea mexicana]KAI9467428.1 hypothetical protein BDB00DRAFT_880595 [Zychaea mexicana]
MDIGARHGRCSSTRLGISTSAAISMWKSTLNQIHDWPLTSPLPPPPIASTFTSDTTSPPLLLFVPDKPFNLDWKRQIDKKSFGGNIPPQQKQRLAALKHNQQRATLVAHLQSIYDDMFIDVEQLQQPKSIPKSTQKPPSSSNKRELIASEHQNPQSRKKANTDIGRDAAAI